MGFFFFFNLPSSSSAAKNPGQDPGPNTASPGEEPVGVRPGLSQSIFEGLNEEGHVSGRRNIQSQRDCRESRREKELQHRFLSSQLKLNPDQKKGFQSSEKGVLWSLDEKGVRLIKGRKVLENPRKRESGAGDGDVVCW
ncbi:hypothetical protein TorRG33x02_228430 [Trema orientale]|uniref:Uncharacterized protein n=1 Tax=Trema orientale TaxID=63057 RepID=A0A2P5E712_TREOI|nr:hypothetical protein TorRG33x02_228430 [Trema orientale]